MVEKGKRIPGDEILYKIANRLNVNSKELIFAIKHIQAPDSTKEFYKTNNNSNNTDVIKHDQETERDDELADLKKGHHNLEDEVKDLKEMITKQGIMISDQESMMKNMLKLFRE